MNSSASRERVFHAAIRLICANGFRETTIGQIEEEAGLTPRAGGFYRHFASKDAVLVEAIERMSSEVISELKLEDVVSLKSPRAELLVIARAMLRHSEKYRLLRLLVQREAHKIPALKRAAKQANARLAAMDVVPWVSEVLKRSRKDKVSARIDTRELGLMIFGPVLLYLISVDRGDPSFQLTDEHFLEPWADHWASWLAEGR